MRGTSRCHQCLRSVAQSTSSPLSLSRRQVSIPAAAFGRSTLFRPAAAPRSSRAIPGFSDKRTIFNLFKKETEAPPVVPEENVDSKLLLKPDNLFHPFESSPSEYIRKRAAHMKEHAFCPHEIHATGKVQPEHVRFTCPDCGIPTYCSEAHWMEDYENHLVVCDALREANEDDHDLVSGREHDEFNYPGAQLEDALINLTTWDTYMYSRQAKAINDPRALRQVTRLLTYPLTITSFLHELSPYSTRNRLTREGLRSLAALRYTLHPPASGAGSTIKQLRVAAPPVRLFILGARAESSLPREVWHQLCYLFPRATFHLIFIGPESMLGRPNEEVPEPTPSNPYGAVIERVSTHMKISTFTDYYHTLHEANYFYPYDPYFDCFVMFHPGVGHPGSAEGWSKTLPLLLDTKCPVLITGYNEVDMQRDVETLEESCSGNYDILLQPGQNRFRSLRWDIDDNDPSDISAGNWGVWAFRGKRYEATTKEMPS